MVVVLSGQVFKESHTVEAKEVITSSDFSAEPLRCPGLAFEAHINNLTSESSYRALLIRVETSLLRTNLASS